MDIAIPKVDGLEATREIKAHNPEIAVLVLTAYDDDQYVFAVLEAGAAGYLLKDVGAEDLIKAIRAVDAGESVLHTAIARKVTDYFARRARGQTSEDTLELTDREMEVLRLAAQGKRNREIAQALTISIRTVHVHMGNIFSKLGVASRTEAVLFALRKGWLSLEDTI
jgi:DNA-binding NarL/FixJ family response regulator